MAPVSMRESRVSLKELAVGGFSSPSPLPFPHSTSPGKDGCVVANSSIFFPLCSLCFQVMFPRRSCYSCSQGTLLLCAKARRKREVGHSPTLAPPGGVGVQGSEQMFWHGYFAVSETVGRWQWPWLSPACLLSMCLPAPRSLFMAGTVMVYVFCCGHGCLQPPSPRGYPWISHNSCLPGQP